MRRARWKRKNVRRVGLRRRRPPAAGGGWLAVPCSSQGRKRPALGETSSPGKYRDTLSLPPRCRSRSREEQPAAATAQPLAALPLTDAAYPLRVKEKQLDATTTPTRSAPSATGRQLQKPQKAQACPKVKQNRSRHRYADPRAHGGPPHRSAPKRFFLFHRARRILFLSRTKREWGAHPLWEQPPWREPDPRGCAPKTGAPPLYFSSNTDTYTVPLTSNPSLAFT